MVLSGVTAKMQTFATSNNLFSQLQTSARARVSQSGFTLIELMVVFAIMGLMISVAPTAFDKIHESAQYRDTLRAIVNDMRSARHLAATEGREIIFSVDLARRRYGFDGKLERELPQPLQIRATVAGQEFSSNGIAAIRFLPEGGSTGGSIEVLRRIGVGARLRVDWMSGRVSQELVAP